MTTEKKGWKELPIAGVCWKPSTEYLTGDWRNYKPVRNPEKCNMCLTCHIYCPDGAIPFNKGTGQIEFDYDHCKGCGICANECPQKAIEMVLE